MSLASSPANGENAWTAASTSPIDGSFKLAAAMHDRALRSCGARTAKSNFGVGEGAVEAAGPALDAAPAGATGFGRGGAPALAAPEARGAPVGETGPPGRPKLGIFFSLGSSLPRLAR